MIKEETNPPQVRDLMIPRRPWTTNGVVIFDAFHNQIFRFNHQGGSDIGLVAHICEHIVKAVNAYKPE